MLVFASAGLCLHLGETYVVKHSCENFVIGCRRGGVVKSNLNGSWKLVVVRGQGLSGVASCKESESCTSVVVIVVRAW